jgi:hypothetical protein
MTSGMYEFVILYNFSSNEKETHQGIKEGRRYIFIRKPKIDTKKRF